MPQAGPDPDIEEIGRRYAVPVLRAVPDQMLDHSLVERLPVEWARSNLVLPVRLEGAPRVLCADPSNLGAQRYLELLLGREMEPLLAPREVVASAIERCYLSRPDTARDFLRGLDEAGSAPTPGRKANDLLADAEAAPVTQLVNLILLEALKAGASDVHFEPFESSLRVRYRIDGVLREQATPPKHLQAPLVSRLKVMARLDIAEKRLPQDGVARVRVGEREFDIRVSTVPVAEGERVVLRILDRNSALLPLSGLGLGPETLARLEAAIAEPHGLLIVAGPTGSGKTTTLYAALQRMDTGRSNILTIEDPIEYQLPSIGQVQVNPKIGLTFASGLRHLLRQDPDVILVGEIRDADTAEIAIRASLTGHVVFSTLHTNDAPGAVVRLTDMGIEPYLLAAALRAVLAQRLVRRLCPKCRRAAPLSAGELAAAGPAFVRMAGSPAWAAAGCSECMDGYRGRTGIFEMMEVDAECADTIRAGPSGPVRMRRFAITKGMKPMIEDGLTKVVSGITSFDEVLRTVGTQGP